MSGSLALREMAMGFFRGKVLCAVVRLGITDALAVGPLTAEELAAATMTNPDAMRRFLRALGSMGVVEEIAPARFELTKFGDPLRRNAPDSVWASMIFWADLLADAWTYLPDCVRAGDRSGAEAARQRDGTTSRWSREPEAQAIFHAVFAEATPDELCAAGTGLGLFALPGRRRPRRWGRRTACRSPCGATSGAGRSCRAAGRDRRGCETV